MAILKHVMKQSDLHPALVAILTDSSGNPVDLENVLSVDFLMRSTDGTVVIESPVTVSESVTGQIAYEWDSGETDTSGVYEAEFIVHWASGPQTFPVQDTLQVEIRPNLITDELDEDPPLFLVTTPAQAYQLTAQSVTREQILRAQAQISSLLDLDLTEDWYSSLSVKDQRRLRNAISWQTQHSSILNPTSESTSINTEGMKSVSVGDVSITYESSASGSSVLDSNLHPYAVQAISRLSWLNSRTIYLEPMFDSRDMVYTNATAFMNPLVRSSNPPDSRLWLRLS